MSVVRSCSNCGVSVQVPPSRQAQKNVFCGRKCMIHYRKEKMNVTIINIDEWEEKRRRQRQ